MSIRLAVFDCDGTLCDGQAPVCTAMEWAFAETALPAPDRNLVRRTVGLSLPQAVALLAPDCPPDQRHDTVEAYKQAFRRARMDGSLHEPLYDGIARVLADARTAGWQLGVATGKSDRGLRSTLINHAIGDLFITLQTADRHPSKPHPAMLEAAMAEAGTTAEMTVMIGDTTYDMDMARAAGVRALGVAWGYHPPEELLAAGAVAVAQTPEELGEMLRD